MALNFPNSPTAGDVYTFNNRTWVWNGSVWESGVLISQTSPGGANLDTLVVADSSGAKYELDKTKNAVVSVSGENITYDFNWWTLNNSSTKTGFLTNSAIMNFDTLTIPPVINTSIPQLGNSSLQNSYDTLMAMVPTDEYVYVAHRNTGTGVLVYNEFYSTNFASTGLSLNIPTSRLVPTANNSSRLSMRSDNEYLYTVSRDNYNTFIDVFNKSDASDKVKTINIASLPFTEIDGLESSTDKLFLLGKVDSSQNSTLLIFNKSNDFAELNNISFDSYRMYTSLAVDNEYVYLMPRSVSASNFLSVNRYPVSAINSSAPFNNITESGLSSAYWMNVNTGVDNEFIYITGHNTGANVSRISKFNKSSLSYISSVNTASGEIIQEHGIDLHGGGYILTGVQTNYDLFARIYDKNFSQVVSSNIGASNKSVTFSNDKFITGGFGSFETNIKLYKWADSPETVLTGYRMVGVTEEL